MKNHLTEILQALKEAGVEFIIGGGVACVLQGVERVTVDLDLAVLMERKNLEKFIGVMHDLGLKPRAPIPPEYLLDPDNIRMMIEEKNAVVFTFIDPDDPLRSVDLFLRPEHSFQNFKDACDQVSIRERPFLILSKDKLIELKSRVDPPRIKDRLDIEELSRLKEEHDERE